MGMICFSFNDLKICIRSNAGKIISVEFSCPDLFGLGKDPLLVEAKKQMIQYLSGDRKVFDLPYDINDGSFRGKVYEVVSRIPYGGRMTYGEVASKLGDVNKARAVGNALNKNDLPIIIPCHRVIAANNKLGGFEAGIEIKKKLLKIEEKNS